MVALTYFSSAAGSLVLMRQCSLLSLSFVTLHGTPKLESIRA